MTLAGLNPGNLRFEPSIPWEGTAAPPHDANGFCCFISMEMGVRALCKNILAAYTLHDCRTVADLIERWAPPEENDTEAYIEDVSARMKVHDDELVDFDDPATLTAAAAAIAHHETGVFLDDATLAAAITSALAK